MYQRNRAGTECCRQPDNRTLRRRWISVSCLPCANRQGDVPVTWVELSKEEHLNPGVGFTLAAMATADAGALDALLRVASGLGRRRCNRCWRGWPTPGLYAPKDRGRRHGSLPDVIYSQLSIIEAAFHAYRANGFPYPDLPRMCRCNGWNKEPYDETGEP